MTQEVTKASKWGPPPQISMPAIPAFSQTVFATPIERCAAIARSIETQFHRNSTESGQSGAQIVSKEFDINDSPVSLTSMIHSIYMGENNIFVYIYYSIVLCS